MPRPRKEALYYVWALFLAASLALAQSAAILPKSITLSYESLLAGSKSAKPLATILYDPDTLKTSVSSWTPPAVDALQSTSPESTSPQLLRILLPSGSSSLTSLGTFNTSLIQNIDLHLSPLGGGSIFSASVSSSVPIIEALPRAEQPSSRKKAKKLAEEQLKALVASTSPKIKITGIQQGVTPKLLSRKPPVVGPDGREQPAVEEMEKSFFQKYWWVFAIGALLMMTSGGDK